ncbi:MAG: hypothetical protein O3A27_04915 [Actinomycetota bacterium]|nr:hypothetical protein [Actinomycetota bacterium]
MHKLYSLNLALILAAGVMIAAPATAAAKISNGVKCKKAGQVTKVSGFKYRCSTNPLKKSKKLTWLSVDCLNSANAYVKSAKEAIEISAKLAAQIPIIELGIVSELASRAKIQSKLDDAKVRLAAGQAKLDGAKSDVEKVTYKAAVGSWKSAVVGFTSAINRSIVDVRKLEAAKLLAVNQPAQLKLDVADTKANAKLICTKGF